MAKILNISKCVKSIFKSCHCLFCLILQGTFFHVYVQDENNGRYIFLLFFKAKPTNCTSDPIPTKLLKQYIDTVNFSLSNA